VERGDECQYRDAGTRTGPPEHLPPAGQGRQASGGVESGMEKATVPPRHLKHEMESRGMDSPLEHRGTRTFWVEVEVIRSTSFLSSKEMV
jgi:hypothetical protein